MTKTLAFSFIAYMSLIHSLSFASDIILSKSIKPHLRSGIEHDLAVLENLKITEEASPSTLALMKLDKFTNETIRTWLEARVNYVIEENALSDLKLKLKKVVFVEREGVTFPNTSTLPLSLEVNLNNPVTTSAEDDGFTVMSNTGAGLYLAGKKESKVYGLKISRGMLKMPIKALAESPRVGIIQIGEGLFERQLTINNEKPNALSNSLNRLATFFHEARHSDGNGKSLAFAHARCPSNHDYAGALACDENLNGPYTVGATMMKEFIKSCSDSDCTEREREMLLIIALDSYGRVLKTTSKGKTSINWDETPESL